MKNKIICFIAFISILSSCQNDSLDGIKPETSEFISIHNNPDLEKIKTELLNNNNLDNQRVNSNLYDIINNADWTKVRRLHDRDNDYEAFGMMLDIESGDYLNNLVIFRKNNKLYPYLYTFNPSEDWKSNTTFKFENSLDGEISIISLLTGKAYHSEKNQHNESNRIITECCSSVLVKKNNNEVVYENGEWGVLIKPATYVRVTICGECPGDGGGGDTNDDWIDGILFEGAGGGSSSGDGSSDLKVPIVESACDDGFVKDEYGNCIIDCPFGFKYDRDLKTCIPDKPCDGDPVKNPEIAPQTNSGIEGGMHDTCVRVQANNYCKGIKDRRKHTGVDIANPFGAPIYSIYGGTATKHTQTNKSGNVIGAGYYVAVVSQINGNTVRMVYFHLQEEGRASGTIKAGDIIGYQGTSGNLGNAIKQGYTVSHVHIKAQNNSAAVDPLKYFHTEIDPETGKLTNPCN